MASKPNKILVEALSKARVVAQEGVIKHTSIKPTYLNVLKRAGYLSPVIRGWYLLTKPEASGSTTIWYVGFWPFLKLYLSERFGKQGYCLGADDSIDIHTGEGNISSQIVVITKKNSNQTVTLPHKTSLVIYSDSKKFPESIENIKDISVMPLPLALCRLSPSYYKTKPLNVEIALKLLPSVSEVSRVLLDQQLVTDAGRLAGAFRVLGESVKADQILQDMQAAGHVVIENNPFEKRLHVLSQKQRIRSPYAGRIDVMWRQMRGDVIKIFPKPKSTPLVEKKIIRVIKDLYAQDAYNSLSIEGYEVTESLIQKIADGKWSPETDPKDREEMNALAAKGYYEAFQAVLLSTSKAIKGLSAGEVFESDLQNWYRALFSPLVKAQRLRSSDLAGYRNSSVYIKDSRHVPPSKEAVLDAMEVLFKLIKEEENPAVRAVLGHFIFVYIHPYMDGNGRIARFILNFMLISGGYTWTVIRTTRRSEYMSTLEVASTKGDIRPFAKFIKSELDYWTKKSKSKIDSGT